MIGNFLQLDKNGTVSFTFTPTEQEIKSMGVCESIIHGLGFRIDGTRLIITNDNEGHLSANAFVNGQLLKPGDYLEIPFSVDQSLEIRVEPIED